MAKLGRDIGLSGAQGAKLSLRRSEPAAEGVQACPGDRVVSEGGRDRIFQELHCGRRS